MVCQIHGSLLAGYNALHLTIERALSVLWMHRSREKIYTPLPPSPILGQKAFFRERGGGIYFGAPRSRNFLGPPPLL